MYNMEAKTYDRSETWFPPVDRCCLKVDEILIVLSKYQARTLGFRKYAKKEKRYLNCRSKIPVCIALEILKARSH